MADDWVSMDDVPSTIEVVQTVVSEDSKYDDSLDELAALNTALCFLCSINAAAGEVEDFLICHPEALLLEGTGEESARAILEQQIRRCECFTPTCNQNRFEIRRVMDRGFEYYQPFSMRPRSRRPVVGEELLSIEQEIRELREQEASMRSRLLETVVEVQSYEDQLGDVSKMDRSPISLLTACTRNSDLFARRTVLEYQVSTAQMNLQAIEREHEEVMRRIRYGRRMQFQLLKRAFEGCQRHVCVTTSRPTLMHG